MKLKEKLAREYALRIVREDCPRTGDPINIAYDYLAGFEKARELAALELDGGTGDAAGLADYIRMTGEGEIDEAAEEKDREGGA